MINNDVQKESMIDNKKKIYLNVPYAEKEDAKEGGARWHPYKLLWFIIPQEILDIDYFSQWQRDTDDEPEDKIPPPKPVDLGGREYFVVEDVAELFLATTGEHVTHSAIGQILVRLKVKRLGYLESGSSGYPTQKWELLWSSLIERQNKTIKFEGRRDKIPPMTAPPLPTRSETLYNKKPVILYPITYPTSD